MMTQELEDALREIVDHDVDSLAFTVVATEVIAMEEYRDARDMILFYIARALERVQERILKNEFRFCRR
jgi:hypothetical protein